MEVEEIPQTTVSISVDSNFLLRGWLIYYGVLMRQAENGPAAKADVIKACRRVLEDLKPAKSEQGWSGISER